MENRYIWNGFHDLKTGSGACNSAGLNGSEEAVNMIPTSQVALALENARLSKEAHGRARELDGLIRISSALRSVDNHEKLLTFILDQTMQLFHARGAALITVNPSSNEMVLELASGQWAKLNGSYPYLGWAKTENENPSRSPHHTDPDITRSGLWDELPVTVRVPLQTYGQMIGELWLGRDNPVSNHEWQVLNAIADMAANAIQRTVLHEQTKKRLERLSTLQSIDDAIRSTLNVNEMLSVLLEKVTNQLHVDAAAVLLRNPDYGTLEFAAGRGFKTKHIENTRLKPGKGIAGRVLLERRIISISNLKDADQESHWPLFLEEDFAGYIGAPLIAKNEVKGVLEIYHRAPLNPDPEWMNFLVALAGQTVIAVTNAELFEHMQRKNIDMISAYDATIEGWSRALDMRDKETEDHTQRVTEMTVRLAKAMGLQDRDLVNIRWGSLLHDIGKLAIPDSILRKPGPLSDEEWEVMRKHPMYAYDLIAPIYYLRQAIDIPYCHHEKWDGSGYPQGLSGEQIPLTARIFAVVDVWDALSSDRPYRAALPKEEVYEYIRQQSGKHFDPLIAEVFLEICQSEDLVASPVAEANHFDVSS